MEHVLAEEIRSGAVIVYLDDIIIASHSSEAHWVDVKAVLKKLRTCGLAVAEDKVVLGSDRLGFLGSIISGGQVSVHPDRIKALEKTPAAATRKELLTFLES
ncbi:putative MarY1-like reverse transcriptase, partial [Gregarina niphandrodes]